MLLLLSSAVGAYGFELRLYYVHKIGNILATCSTFCTSNALLQDNKSGFENGNFSLFFFFVTGMLKQQLLTAND